MRLDIPLMHNNITADDRKALIRFLDQDVILTQSNQVREFEAEWSEWLGVKHSVFVNSGASANVLTIAALKHIHGGGEVIVPPLTWVSDIASVMQWGFTPVFVDIDPKTLGMDTEEVLKKVNAKTRAVFLTHVLGYNGLTSKLLSELKKKNIPLIEDVCEAHGATFQGKKLGNYGLVSNFSFYYAHHMSTIEGGMVCTNDEEFHEVVRMCRSHGMVREATSESVKASYLTKYPSLNPEFIFAFPSYNMRSTELNAVIGRNQLGRLDANNEKRRANLNLFLENLDGTKYRKDFSVDGSVNYAFTLVLKNPDDRLCAAAMRAMGNAGIEYRRGMSGGGNQMRQPYLEKILPPQEYKKYPQVEHVHFYGFYLGNYPDLERDKILGLCDLLNKVEPE